MSDTLPEAAPTRATATGSGNAPVVPRMERRPALDGLRGLAVVGVVAFHLGYLQGGFLGVDMFFTLSGYLITRLLLIEHAATGTISFSAFWSRRAWRLLPALYVLLAALCAYALFGASPVELDDLRAAGIATLLFVANWWFIASDAGYWDEFAVPSPLEHVWSLAIEQQFYVVWPVVVAVILRGRDRLKALLLVTVVLVGASTLWLGVLSRGDVSRAYFGSGSRSGSILVGAVLAVLIQRQDQWLASASRSRLAPWVAGAAAAALVASWIGINGELDTWFYLGGYLAHALAVAVIIAVLTFQTTGRAVQLLELPVLRRLGVISYGLYLWHWPVIVILNSERSGLNGLTLLVARIAVSVLLTEMSYRLVEVPARRELAGKTKAIIAFPLAALVLGFGLVVTTQAISPEPLISAPPPPAPAETVTATSAPEPDSSIGTSDTTSDTASSTATTNPSATPTTITAGSDPTASTTTEVAEPALLVTTPTDLPDLRVPTEDDPLRVLLVGDSYMYDAEPGIAAALAAMSIDTTGAADLGFTITGDGWEDRLSGLVADNQPDLVVAMWARFDARWLESNSPADYQERLDRAVEILTADGAALGFIGLAPSLTAGVDREPVDRSINEIFAAISERFERAFYIDPDPIVSPDGTPERRIDTPEGELLVRKVDVSHYCSDGSARFGLAISELLHDMTGEPVADPATWWAELWRLDKRYDEPSGSCS